MKNTSFRFISLALLLTAFIQTSAFAANSFELKAKSLAATELAITFTDKEPVSGVCPLLVQRMEYIAGINSLLVTIEPNSICTQDNFGKREGTLKWNVSNTMVIKSNTKIILNGLEAGSVQIENGEIK